MKLFDILIPMMIALGFSMFCSMLASKGFSLNIFLAVLTIAICVLVWLPLLPTYFIAMAILLLVVQLFADRLGIGKGGSAGI